MNEISIIGCGEIGSRHLQAILKLSSPITVNVVEPSDVAQKKAISRLSEIKFNDNNKINWLKSINELKSKSDLSIIATNSFGRINLISSLLKKNHSRFLIEKMVCQSSEEYEELISSFKKYDAKGWVNTSRRYFESYKKINDMIKANKPLVMNIISGNYGLGSNAVHFIDLFLWMTKNTNISLNGNYLTNILLPSKRGKPFVEFTGTIIGSNNNSILSISFLPVENLPYTVNIIQNDLNIMINETNNDGFFLTKTNSKQFKFKNEFTSITTTKIASEILKFDTCKLPTLKELKNTHNQLFKVFNTHIEKITNKTPSLCPIT
jgi:hypothetical protein